MPGEVCEEIISRADGVPLFLEELTVTILGSGLLYEGQSRFALTGPFSRLAIPDTLQDLLTARLDQHPRLKTVAQIGAVIGREFAHELIVAVAPQDGHEIEAILDQLVESGLLVRRGQPPNVDYVFRHSLVRDAAYESLLKSARRQHHSRVARILTERFSTVVENEPEIVAYHFSEATMVFEAVSYWEKAAQRAIERSANVEAETHLAKGLEMLHGIPATDERLRLEAGLQNIKGVCLMPIRGFGSPDVAEAFSTAASISETVNDTRGRFLALRGLGQIPNDLRRFAGRC